MLFALVAAALAHGQADYVRANYTKREVRIPMRDGKTLFTSIYAPKNPSKPAAFLMMRTPYSCAPYGESNYRNTLGPEAEFTKEGYIFVYQDVRGRYMSEGDFHWMNPYIPNKKPGQVDESTDMWDTCEWLLKNVPNNNGKVGVYGTSFPGHYAAQTLIDPHPSLAAVSPQAPMDDNWLGDDMHHNGAFFLPHAMGFISGFGVPRQGPQTQYGPRAFTMDTPDGYDFYLRLGPVGPNSNERYNMKIIELWQKWIHHPDYDDYWKPQQVSQHLKRVGKVPTLVVGGWFDAEDLQGPLRIYKRIEEWNPGNRTTIMMGPFYHGSWNGGPGNALHDISFTINAGEDFRTKIQMPFFRYYLKGEGSVADIPEAAMFDSGADKWLNLPEWPPKSAMPINLMLKPDGTLDMVDKPARGTEKALEWISDPAKPVPCSNSISRGMPREYMLEDQRFADRRPDVVTFASAPMSEDTTLVGPILVNLKVSTSGSDSDYIVKLIDVYPNDSTEVSARNGASMAGYQMMVRGEPMRARYRNSWSKPEPMEPNKRTEVNFEMPDICHTFKKGHRIMVQVHSTWFPLIDRNPQTYVPNIFFAKDTDFVKATQKIFVGGAEGSRLVVKVMR